LNTLIQKAKYSFKTLLWILNAYVGKPVWVESPEKLTVLITYFNPVRMKKINHQIRNILKCEFVDKLIISNHNPDIHIQDKLKVNDDRLTILNQSVKRGCGFRWLVANGFDFKYLIVIDDDFLISAQQLASLFRRLLEEPNIPHGLAGMNCLPAGGFEYRDKENVVVDFLCEVYAVTKSHLDRFMEINSSISSDAKIARIVDSTADFMIVSQTGTSRPKIHDVGRLFRDETFKTEGVAVHKNQTFEEHMEQILNALRSLGLGERR